MRAESLSFLKRLLDTPSPSGFERAGQRVWLDYVKPFATRTWNDAYGNCFAELCPEASDAPTVAVCGHADEIGLMVNHIDDKGYIYCKQIGGIDAGSIVGKRIQFQSSVAGVTNPVLGVIGATAIHLQDKASEGKVRKLHELFIDIGARTTDEAAARLNIGDAGVFLESFMHISEDIVIARAILLEHFLLKEFAEHFIDLDDVELIARAKSAQHTLRERTCAWTNFQDSANARNIFERLRHRARKKRGRRPNRTGVSEVFDRLGQELKHGRSIVSLASQLRGRFKVWGEKNPSRSCQGRTRRRVLQCAQDP